MGAGQGTALRLIDDQIELLRETRDFARWTLTDVTQLHQRFRKTHGLAITESQFENLLLLKASDIVSSKQIFNVLDTNRDGRIDGLEFLAALLCVCRASFEEKARFAFELFDFNLNGSLSLTELALLMKSVWVGMSLLTGHRHHRPPSPHHTQTATSTTPTSVAKFLQLSQLAFDRYDRDGGASLQYEEFIEWARSNREFMLQVEQFRVISEKAVGFEETLSLPDGSDDDSDLESEAGVPVQQSNCHKSFGSVDPSPSKTETRRADPVTSSSSPAPWMIEPTNLPLTNPAKYDFPPAINVDLEWIYGYNGTTTRNALRILSNGDVVYVVSKYAVVYTPQCHAQRHYFGHKYPITCLDVNASATIVATGDAVPLQHQHSEIHVWSGLTLECLAVLSSFHVDSIASVAFPAAMGVHMATPMATSGSSGGGGSGGSGKSSSGGASSASVASAKKQHHAADTLLVSIGTDANASMALWDWHNARLLASGRAIGKRKRVLCVAMSEDGHEIVVCGEHFIVFHHVDGRFFKMKKPKALETKLQAMGICLSATYYGPHTAVVGTARGELLQFHHMQLVRVVQAHDIGQSINVCMVSCRSMVLFTAGKDGVLRQWDSTLQPIGTAIDLHQSSHVQGLEDEDFRIHSMGYDATRQRFIVGTRHGHLLEVLESTASIRCDDGGGNQHHEPTTRVIASGHRGADVSGLATSRFGVCFTTCSVADKMVRVWNMRRRVEQHAIKIRFPPSACVYSTANGGEFLAVGGADGSIALFRAKNMALLSQMKNTQSSVSCMKFHPSQAALLLAVACDNGLVYLYSIDDASDATAPFRFHRFALLKPSPGEAETLVVRSLDFSTDGRYLKSQHGYGGQVTLRFWQVRSGSQSVSRVTSMSTIRNVQWQSYSSEIGWHVGALRETNHAVACLSVNAAASVVATIDTRGQLSFHHFPISGGDPSGGENQNQLPLAIVVANAHLHDRDATAALDFALHDSLLLSTSSGLESRDSGSVICQWHVTNEAQDPQPHATAPLEDDKMWDWLAALGLESLYYRDDSYVARANGSRIDAVLPPTTSLTSATGASSSLDLSVRGRTEAPDLDLSLAFVYGLNHTQSGVNQILTGMSSSTGTSSSIVYGAGTLLVSLLMTATQTRQQRILLSGLNYDISSIVKHSTNVLAVGSQRESRVLIWQWEPHAQLLGVLRGPQHTCHVLTAFDSGEYNEQQQYYHHPQSRYASRDLAAVVWYSRQRHTHVVRFYHWRQSHEQDERCVSGKNDEIQADMTRLPVLFGFFTPPLASATALSQAGNVVGFVSGGVDHVSFWWLTVSTGHVVSQSGVFGRHALVETALCGAYASPFVLTGMKSGAIVVWDNGHAAFSLPALESAEKGGDAGKLAVVSLVVVPAKQQVVAALRSGHIVLFVHNKENDVARYRANAFLQRVRVVNVYDDACAWKMLKPSNGRSSESDAGAAATQVKQALATSSALQSLAVLDELQGGLIVVLSGGLVLQLDAQALTATAMAISSYPARVVLDVGQQVASVALHPLEQWIALGNSDGRVSVYALETQALIAETRTLSDSVTALAWQSLSEPGTARIAASLANGRIAMLSGSTLAVETEFPCGPNTAQSQSNSVKKWCWTLKFSPASASTSQWLAVACRDYHIYVYKCMGGGTDAAPLACELAHDFAGHTAPILSLDFSIDAQWLQSSTSSIDCQLLRWQLSEPGGDKSSSAGGGDSIAATAAWASWTVPFSGPVAGLTEVFQSKVTAVARILSEDPLAPWSSKLPTLLLGTETGRVLLGWYPLRCGDSENAMFKEYDGYFATNALVEQAQFSAQNQFAVARSVEDAGGGVVLVWKTDYDDELRQIDRLATSGSTGGSSSPSTNSEGNCEITTAPGEEEEDVETTAASALLDKEDQRFEVAAAQSGDEFMAVKPWLGAIREPSVLPPGATSAAKAPDAELALEFVYGVNANATNTRNDVFYADDTWEIVYGAASFGVVYNTKSRTQLLNATHSGQLITSVAVHPTRGDLVVTGEIAGGKKKPRLVAWDANSGSTLTQIESIHSRGVALLAFAPSGDRVASVGMDDDHVLAIYALSQSHGLAKFKLLAHMKTSKQPVYSLAFHFESDMELVTAGLKHVLFWSTAGDASSSSSGGRGHRSSSSASRGGVSQGADGALTLSMKKGLFGTAKGVDGGAKAKILAAVYVPRSQQQSHVVTGQHDGSLFVWKARQCVDAKLHAHAGAIYALVVDHKKPHTVYSSGQDGKIHLWNTQLELLVTLDLDKLGSTLGSEGTLFNTVVKSLAVRESRILFSTDGGDVAELIPQDLHNQQPASAPSYKLQIHLRSHCKGELWGLATHPAKLQFASAGDDGSVRLWDAPTRSLLAMYRAKSSSGFHKWRSLAFSSDGSHVVAGASDGNVVVLTESLESVVTTWKVSAKAVAVLKFSPESRLLAIGSHDQGIHIYDGHTYKPKGVCRGHSSTVTHLDFSVDGRVLQTTSSAGELLFWDVAGSDFKQIPSATSVRDTQWATWSLPFGWPVQGIWPPGSDGSDVNAVSRSGDRKVVATGDDFGLVKLFSHPCAVSQAPYKTFAGHASHVTNCCFTKDDYFLLSTGGLDNTVCQYKYFYS